MKTITTTYQGPDLDGYGCAMAYAELLRAQGEDAEACIWGEPHIEVQWLLETFSLTHAKGPSEDTESNVVLLDASNPDDLPKSLKPEQVIEIIDHRKIHKADKFPNAKNQIELVGAAATLIAERFKEAGINPSKESALFLYGGILSNTQNFTAIATDRDKEMAEWLKELSEAPEDLVEQMFTAKSDLAGDRLKKTLFGDLKTLDINGIPVTIAQLELYDMEQLLIDRHMEIDEILRDIKKQEGADYTFLNVKDITSSVSAIICVDQETADLLHDLPDAEWNGWIGISPELTLRKELSAWLLERLK